MRASAAPLRRTDASPPRRLSAGNVASHTLLAEGASGKEVKQLQRLLRQEGLLSGKTSGVFDAATRSAVEAFQKARGLTVDGLVGQQTWGAFDGKSFPPGTAMLKKATHVHATGGGTATPAARPDRSPAAPIRDAYEDQPVGPGKRVKAYVNGSARTISVVPVGNGQYMQADAAKRYKAMLAAASRDGIRLSSTSGFRTMDQQQALWNRYGAGRAARPGYSNHQNGISMDIGGVNGYGTAGFSWLKKNADKYGFVNDVPGEWWHWTFRG